MSNINDLAKAASAAYEMHMHESLMVVMAHAILACKNNDRVRITPTTEVHPSVVGYIQKALEADYRHKESLWT